jgi:hypothetical protein
VSDVLWASVFLARDVDACRALLLGVPVPRRRLHPGAMVTIDELLEGEPLVMEEALALRCALAMESPTDRIWRRQRLATTQRMGGKGDDDN